MSARPPTCMAGIAMRTTAGAPSHAAAERWARRSGHLAAWLLAQWAREQAQAAQQPQERPSRSLDTPAKPPIALDAVGGRVPGSAAA
jgi:hypothetical protein